MTGSQDLAPKEAGPHSSQEKEAEGLQGTGHQEMPLWCLPPAHQSQQGHGPKIQRDDPSPGQGIHCERRISMIIESHFPFYKKQTASKSSTPDRGSVESPLWGPFPPLTSKGLARDHSWGHCTSVFFTSNGYNTGTLRALLGGLV